MWLAYKEPQAMQSTYSASNNIEWLVTSSRQGKKWVSEQRKKWAIDLPYATVGLVVQPASDNDETTDEWLPEV